MQEAFGAHTIGRSTQKFVLGHKNNPDLMFCTLVLHHTGLFSSQVPDQFRASA